MSFSSTSIQDAFRHIAPLFSYSRAQLIIHKNSQGRPEFLIQSRSRWQLYSSRFYSRSRTEMDSVLYFKQIFGTKRLERIFLRPELGLNINQLRSNQLDLGSETLHKIFIGLADIRLEDLAEAAPNFYALSTSELDALYNELLPFEKLKGLFTALCQPVSYRDSAKTSGKGFAGLQERVWTIQKARKEFLKNRLTYQHAVASEIDMLTSRLADREPPVGTVVRLRHSYFVVERTFAKAGAHVSLLSEIAGSPRTLLVCRGTAARFSATGGYFSVLNCYLKEIGLLGIKRIWFDLKRTLEEKNIQQVEIFGKSLGGGHAEYLTALILGKTALSVPKLSTHCSVGTPDSVQRLFTAALEKNGKTPPDILILRNSGKHYKLQVDHIPCVGGPHLHTPATTQIWHVCPEMMDATENLSPASGKGVTKVAKFLLSFTISHPRQTTLNKPFYVYERGEIAEEIAQGKSLEPLRQIVAHCVHFATLTLNNRESFAAFYERA